MQQVPLFIVNGLLESGKTTFIFDSLKNGCGVRGGYYGQPYRRNTGIVCDGDVGGRA